MSINAKTTFRNLSDIALEVSSIDFLPVLPIIGPVRWAIFQCLLCFSNPSEYRHHPTRFHRLPLSNR